MTIASAHRDEEGRVIERDAGPGLAAMALDDPRQEDERRRTARAHRRAQRLGPARMALLDGMNGANSPGRPGTILPQDGQGVTGHHVQRRMLGDIAGAPDTGPRANAKRGVTKLTEWRDEAAVFRMDPGRANRLERDASEEEAGRGRRRTALLLARIQFGFTVSFHFIFPAFSIGLASYLAVLEALVAEDRQGLSRPVQILAEDLRGRVRDGRGLRHRHVLPVRHQLVGVLRQGRADHRPAHGL